MCILKDGVALLYQSLKLHSACREAELQPTDFMDPISRILTNSDSVPSITLNSPPLRCVSSAAVSFLFCLFPLLFLSLTQAHTLKSFILFFLACCVLPSPCIPDCAVPCWASGSSLVLQRRSLIQCFKKLSGRMWLISFYTKSRNASHSLSCRMRLACEMTLMLFSIKHFLSLSIPLSPFHFSDFFLFIPFHFNSSLHSFICTPFLSQCEMKLIEKGLKKKTEMKDRLTDGVNGIHEWDEYMGKVKGEESKSLRWRQRSGSDAWAKEIMRVDCYT